MPSSAHQSLHGLSIGNSWFAVHPVFWTSQHLDLLGIRFVHIDGPRHAVQPRRENAVKLDPVKVIFHIMRFASVPEPEDKLKSAFYLLCVPGSPLRPRSKPPKFFYAERAAHETLCYVFHVTRTSTRAQAPVVGFTYYRAFNWERDRRYTPRKHPKARYGKTNGPVEEICKILLRKVTPQKWEEDPYIVCLLLSLAQAQAIKQKREKEKPDTFPVRLLVAVDGDTEFAHVFQAEIDARILEALDKPTFSFNGVTWPTITHSKVAFGPYPSFPDRLLAEVLES
ncbi:hypothetical protein FVEG_12205 [Fusarium verticillioides 7600]|uniref:Uncharacterized protein n=1 Tax=Gibberella moniliformis (strain M3125 / FGSC 7600) TaxID=334819 RepID=W7N173_GIBM7|nr:hypothetical protein FVEG_12205 [Fusarium verticillioides 7600]EWG53869.1 hypothetical protein FVEG_12205 [Fusarium verticillioides 7600]